MQLEFRLIQCAVALEDHRSFVKAAAALHMSQPGLSRKIAELEKQTGIILFRRLANGVEPTDEGVLFLQKGRRLLASLEELHRETALIRHPEERPFRVCAGMYPSAMMVEPALAALVRLHPQIRLSITADFWNAVLPGLRKRQFDVCVIDISFVEDWTNLQRVELQPHQAYFAVRAGHPLLKLRRSLEMADLLPYPRVLPTGLNPNNLGALVEAWRRSSGNVVQFPATAEITSNSVPVLKQIVQHSDGWGVVPLMSVMPEVEAGTLAVLPVVVPSFQGKFAIVQRADETVTPYASDFVRLVLEEDTKLIALEKQTHARLFSAPASRPRAGIAGSHALPA